LHRETQRVDVRDSDDVAGTAGHEALDNDRELGVLSRKGVLD
jgi:hypothetical protein